MGEYWQVRVVADQPEAGRLADRPLGQLLADLGASKWSGRLNIRSDRTLSVAVSDGRIGLYARGASADDIMAAFAWHDGQFVLKPGMPELDRVEKFVPLGSLVGPGLLKLAPQDLIKDRLLRVADFYPVGTEALARTGGPAPHLMTMLSGRCTGRASVQEVSGRKCAFGRVLCLALDLRYAVLSPSPQRQMAQVTYTTMQPASRPARPMTLDVPAITGAHPRLAVANHPESVSFLPATSETLPRFLETGRGDATPLPVGEDERAAQRFFRLGKELATRGRLRRACDAFHKAAELDPECDEYARRRDELLHLIR
jgi:hypothetical protein